LYTELFYAIVPTLFLCFLLICYDSPILLLLVLFMSLFFSSKCVWLSCITEQQVSPHSLPQ